MKIAIMQPYFLPYIGYFQLINAVDTFVVYENVQYQKKSWIKRNRYLVNGKAAYFSISLKKASTYLNITDRYISDHFDRNSLLNKISNAYRKAPYFAEIFKLFKDIVSFEDNNLVNYIFNSIINICNHLEIRTEMVRSSTINIDNSLRSFNKICAICQALNAKLYINAIGGMKLYSKELFARKGIKLIFMQSKLNEYKQFNNKFVPSLSIIDVLMFNAKESVRQFLNDYELL